MTTPTLRTATISCTYCWHPGHGILVSLRETGADVGYTRMQVEGTAADFRKAIELAEIEYKSSNGSHRTALTRLIRRLRPHAVEAETVVEPVVQYRDLTSNEVHTLEVGVQFRAPGDEGEDEICTYHGEGAAELFRVGEIVEFADTAESDDDPTWYASEIVSIG